MITKWTMTQRGALIVELRRNTVIRRPSSPLTGSLLLTRASYGLSKSIKNALEKEGSPSKTLGGRGTGGIGSALPRHLKGFQGLASTVHEIRDKDHNAT